MRQPTPASGSSATPWTGRPRRVDLICLGAITLSGVYYLALLPLRPLLLAGHTLLLLFLSGSSESLVAAGAFVRVGHLSLPWVVLGGLFGLMKFDLLSWWAGRLWGPRFGEFLTGRPGGGGVLRRWTGWWRRRMGRLSGRLTPLAIVVAEFLPVPAAIFYAAAGWEGMSLPLFLLLDAIGELLWGGLLIGLGYGFGHHAVRIVETISRYGLWIALAIVAIIVVRAVWSGRQASRRRGPEL